MSKNTFSTIASVVFLIVAVAHALRLFFKWDVLIAGWLVPTWLSAVALVVAGYLAYEGFRISKGN